MSQDIEVAALIGHGDVILKIYLGIPGYVPDSHERWMDIWNNMGEIRELAHTHPKGHLGFSEEDRTTMSAVEKGTGKEFRWSVITDQQYLVQDFDGERELEEDEPWWVDILRRLSYGARNG